MDDVRSVLGPLLERIGTVPRRSGEEPVDALLRAGFDDNVAADALGVPRTPLEPSSAMELTRERDRLRALLVRAQQSVGWMAGEPGVEQLTVVEAMPLLADIERALGKEAGRVEVSGFVGDASTLRSMNEPAPPSQPTDERALGDGNG